VQRYNGTRVQRCNEDKKPKKRCQEKGVRCLRIPSWEGEGWVFQGKDRIPEKEARRNPGNSVVKRKVATV